MLRRAAISISRAPSASLVESAGGSNEVWRVDPAAALREAMERNAWEAREEAAVRARADTQAAESTQAEAATKAHAEADAKDMEDPDGSGIPEAANLGQPESPVVEAQAPNGTAEADQEEPEQELPDFVVPGAEVTQHTRGCWKAVWRPAPGRG